MPSLRRLLPSCRKVRKKYLFKFSPIFILTIILIASTAAPKISIPPLDDADEPYSPGGSDDELPPPAPRIANDLERQVDEINKQIAAQQMEIAGLLKVEPKVSSN